jgi:hypothetical protein
MVEKNSASQVTFLERLPNFSLTAPFPTLKQPPLVSNPKTLLLDLIPVPNRHTALDLVDLALTNLYGLALAYLAHDLALKLVASTSLTLASRR